MKQLPRRRRTARPTSLVLALLGGWFLHPGARRAFGGPAAYIEVSGHSMDGTYKHR